MHKVIKTFVGINTAVMPAVTTLRNPERILISERIHELSTTKIRNLTLNWVFRTEQLQFCTQQNMNFSHIKRSEKITIFIKKNSYFCKGFQLNGVKQNDKKYVLFLPLSPKNLHLYYDFSEQPQKFSNLFKKTSMQLQLCREEPEAVYLHARTYYFDFFRVQHLLSKLYNMAPVRLSCLFPFPITSHAWNLHVTIIFQYCIKNRHQDSTCMTVLNKWLCNQREWPPVKTPLVSYQWRVWNMFS